MTEPDRPLAQAPNATWLTWALVVVGVLWVAKAGLAPVTLAPLTVALAVILLLNAVRFAPHGEDPARRRLPRRMRSSAG